MAKMDDKAGNKGDQLKHALILEILMRCGGWTPLTYAETHSGAGIYHGEAQASKELKYQYICNLKQRHDELINFPDALCPGATYFESLRDWWNAEARHSLYPGSVVQAVTFLDRPQGGTGVIVRVTEADPITHERLTDALQPFDVVPRCSGFQDQINWLCENDQIVLVVDPFAIIGDVPVQDRQAQLSNGRIDLGTLRTILDGFPGKSKAVVMLWTSFGQQNRDFNQPLERMLREWTLANGTHFRRYHDNASHNVYVIGFGDGQEVVGDLPDGEAWNSSWMQGVIREIQ